MSDVDIRALERAWLASKDPVSEAALVQARWRAGVMAEEDLRLAFCLGSPGAQECLAPTSPAPSLTAPEVVVRAVSAIGRVQLGILTAATGYAATEVAGVQARVMIDPNCAALLQQLAERPLVWPPGGIDFGLAINYLEEELIGAGNLPAREQYAIEALVRGSRLMGGLSANEIDEASSCLGAACGTIGMPGWVSKMRKAVLGARERDAPNGQSPALMTLLGVLRDRLMPHLLGVQRDG